MLKSLMCDCPAQRRGDQAAAARTASEAEEVELLGQEMEDALASNADELELLGQEMGEAFVSHEAEDWDLMVRDAREALEGFDDDEEDSDVSMAATRSAVSDNL